MSEKRYAKRHKLTAKEARAVEMLSGCQHLLPAREAAWR